MNAYRFLAAITVLLVSRAATVGFAQGAQVDVSPPSAATAGSTVTVKWSGPNGPGDYITVVRRGAGPSEYLDYRATSDGRLPVNTDGGLIANGEPIGASGLRQIVECVQQLRRRAGDRQVPGEPRTAFTQVYGAPGISVCSVLAR